MFLGIDIGTTNVKVVLVEESTHHVLCKQTQSLGELENVDIHGAAEQSVSQIFHILNECMNKLEIIASDVMHQVRGIGVCGQMHGCVLWNSNCAHLFNEGMLCTELTESMCTNLITWQDSRCDPSFLSSLPKLTPLTKPPVSAGYGCATLAWLQSHNSEVLSRYDRAGTIMDMVVCALCSGGHGDVVMSSQNAVSWGYFDQSSMQWHKQILEGIFPLNLLPMVVNVPSIAGCLVEEWHKIPRGTMIAVAMGDMQCSVYAAQPTLSDAVLNMGSASQLVVIKPSQRESPPIPESVDEVPYFNGDHLLVAAALGGGNTISFLVGTLQSWLEELNAVERPDFQDLYEKVMQAALKKLDTTLQVDPRVWGERHAPDARGKVWNVRPDNVSVGDMGSAMVRGVVENLLDMMTPHLLHKVVRVLGTGQTLQRHKIFREHICHTFNLPLVLKNEADAPLGAAMAMSHL